MIIEKNGKDMSAKIKTIGPTLAVIIVLVGWGMAWSNQNAKINTNKSKINMLSSQVETVSSQATEADKAIVRMETKIEYIIKGIDEIKAEVKGGN
jgi:peptidoglycan hydrolase CwlO-like protein